MGQNRDNQAPLLKPGSRITFGPFDNGKATSAMFIDECGRTMTFSSGSVVRGGHLNFYEAMSAFACSCAATVIGLTFGLKIAPANSEGLWLAIVYEQEQVDYVAPVGLVFDRSKKEIIIKLPHKNIAYRMSRVPERNLENIVEIMAALIFSA